MKLKIFFIVIITLLSFTNVIAERSVPNPAGRSHLWNEPSQEQQAQVEENTNALREQNNLAIQELQNQKKGTEEPLIKTIENETILFSQNETNSTRYNNVITSNQTQIINFEEPADKVLVLFFFNWSFYSLFILHHVILVNDMKHNFWG